MSEEILRVKEKYWDNKITLEDYINSTEKEGWIDTGDYEYEFYYIIDNLKKTQLLENIIKEVRNWVNSTIDIIKQQPTGNDEWILERLNSFISLLDKGE